MARRSAQGQFAYQRQLEKNRQRDTLLQDLEQDRKLARYYDESIQREEKVYKLYTV